MSETTTRRLLRQEWKPLGGYRITRFVAMSAGMSLPGDAWTDSLPGNSEVVNAVIGYAELPAGETVDAYADFGDFAAEIDARSSFVHWTGTWGEKAAEVDTEPADHDGDPTPTPEAEADEADAESPDDDADGDPEAETVEVYEAGSDEPIDEIEVTPQSDDVDPWEPVDPDGEIEVAIGLEVQYDQIGEVRSGTIVGATEDFIQVHPDGSDGHDTDTTVTPDEILAVKPDSAPEGTVDDPIAAIGKLDPLFLEVESCYVAEVNNVEPYGVFVSLNPQAPGHYEVSGLVHKTKLPLARHPDEYAVGDRVVVEYIDKSEKGLSFRLYENGEAPTGLDSLLGGQT